MTETQSDRWTSNPLRSLWELWKRAAKRIGNFQARVLLVLFYFIVFCPFALVVRWGSDPLGIKEGAPRGWRPRNQAQRPQLDEAMKQF